MTKKLDITSSFSFCPENGYITNINFDIVVMQFRHSLLKNFLKKVLDKPEKVWYNIYVNKKAARHKRKVKTMEKQFEKMIELKAVKNRIAEIERLLDDDSTTDEEFDALMLESQRQTALLGELERSIRLNDVKEITPNAWTVNFLKSFGTTSVTRVISIKQYDVLKRINNGKPFKYNGLRYDISKGSNNFGTLIVTECI